MIGMQYKIILPNDYDMGIIRKRVTENGHKTDGFPGLMFKAYLISEREKHDNLYNSYSPLYIWKNSHGMNDFIFEGYYDKVVDSFGWQHIHIGVPLSINLDKNFNQSKYVVEFTGNIPECKSLMNSPFKAANDTNQDQKSVEKNLGNLLVYNPDKWGYSQFSFYQEQPIIDSTEHHTVYEILHVSQ